jgi:CRISPR-associated protein Cas6
MSATIDLVFPVGGERVPVPHGYPLYAGLSRVLPALHDGSVDFGLGSITGQYVGRGTLRLHSRGSILRLRLGAVDIPRVLALAGKAVDVAGDRVRLGAPHVEALMPAADLVSHFVTIKHAEDADAFQASMRVKLNEIGVGGTVTLPTVEAGPHAGKPRRQVLRVKGAAIVGYAVRVSGLSAEESLRLQSATHFGRRRMGAAFFVPAEGDS